MHIPYCGLLLIHPGPWSRHSSASAVSSSKTVTPSSIGGLDVDLHYFTQEEEKHGCKQLSTRRILGQAFEELDSSSSGTAPAGCRGSLACPRSSPTVGKQVSWSVSSVPAHSLDSGRRWYGFTRACRFAFAGVEPEASLPRRMLPEVPSGHPRLLLIGPSASTWSYFRLPRYQTAQLPGHDHFSVTHTTPRIFPETTGQRRGADRLRLGGGIEVTRRRNTVKYYPGTFDFRTGRKELVYILTTGVRSEPERLLGPSDKLSETPQAPLPVPSASGCEWLQRNQQKHSGAESRGIVGERSVVCFV
ncbi:hypothetical protein VTK26DRAFT_6358 [Humicola hyalothermophila]